MTRLLKLLLVATLLLPLATGLVAVVFEFGDPWGMGAESAWGVFLTAALPFLVPGIYQVSAWPLTFGVAIVLSPLALLRRRTSCLIATLLVLTGMVSVWLLGWILAPDYLNTLFDGKTYVRGHLNSGVWKFGMYLLTDATVLSAAVSWWFCRASANREQRLVSSDV